MDSEKKWYKHWLSTLDEQSVETLCRLARLMDDETEIIVSTCCRWKDEFFLADKLNMSVKNLHKRKMFAVNKLICWCRKQYPGENESKRVSILWETILKAEGRISS